MTCPDCAKATTNKHHGVYRMQCLQCCARLVASATSRQHQEAMLTAISQFRDAPPRRAILDLLKQTYSAPQTAKPMPEQEALI